MSESNDNQPEGVSLDVNSFESPHTTATQPTEPHLPGRKRRGRLMLVLAGIFLVPLAAIIGGFCCCWAGFAVASVIPPRAAGFFICRRNDPWLNRRRNRDGPRTPRAVDGVG